MNSKIKKPSIGQKLFIVHKSHWGYGHGLYPDTKVTKVGRKYFKVMMPLKFEMTFKLDGWGEKSNYPAYYAYESQKEYEDDIKKNNIISILKDNIHYKGLLKLSLEQLTSIGKILDIDLDKKLSAM